MRIRLALLSARRGPFQSSLWEVSVVTLLCLASSGEAAQRIWDGGARGNGWSDLGNWTQLSVPSAGDDLIFPAGALQPANENDFPAGTSFGSLTFSGAGYTASGNGIGLTAGLNASHAAGNTVINLPIVLEANQTLTVSQADANLFLNGAVNLDSYSLVIDGAGQVILTDNLVSRFGAVRGSLRKQGPGTLVIFQHPTFDGNTIVNGGTLNVSGSLSNSSVTLNGGATLRGTGKVGGLTANSGAVVSPGSALSPDILDSLGDVALNAGSTLNIRLNGTIAGINHDQLRVQGAVTLGGTLNVTASFVPTIGERFTIIANDGTEPVMGTFAGLPEGAVLTLNGRPFRVSYGARFGGGIGRTRDVSLEAVPALAVWDGGGGLNKFWSQPLNWMGDVLPLPGDDVQFGLGASDTINDFPAGRRFGSLILGGGTVRMNGNAATFEGDIHDTADGDVEITLPVLLDGGIDIDNATRLTVNGAVSLTQDQRFRVANDEARVAFNGDVALGGFTLTVDKTTNSQSGQFSGFATMLMLDVTGTGRLIKQGPGMLTLENTSVGTELTINEGVVFGSNAGGDFPGAVAVNAGTTLVAQSVGDLTVMGGTIEPRYFGLLLGGSATFQSAVLNLDLFFNSSQNPAVVNHLRLGPNSDVNLNGCTLAFHISPSALFDLGSSFIIVDPGQGTRTGTFTGLPEGARFLEEGHVVSITYQAGAAGNTVVLTMDPPFVWDGGGSGNVWGTAANWVADFAPIPGSALVFPANVSKVGMINAFDPDTRFASLTFTGPSYLLVGNSFRLTEGVYNDFASGDTTISADIVASGSFTNLVGSSSRLLLEGGVTGNASWRKTGTGTLRLTGTSPNTMAQMQVWGGELELDKTPGVNAISAQLDIGDGTNDIRGTLLGDHQIADSAGVTIRNRARLVLNGNDEAIHGLLGDGTVVLNSRMLPGGLGRTSRLTVTQGMFPGTITGDGGLTKTGSNTSTLTLSGSNLFSGLTILNSGSLVIEGTLAESPIRLDGGILRGRGRVGTITGNLGGTLQPGFGGADFQVALHSEDVSLNPTTTFRTLLTAADPGYENHKLQVTGTVNLDGSVLSVDLLGAFKPTNGFTFVIIENDGNDPIVGAFAGLPEGAVFGGDGLPFRISYVGGTGNDVVLTRVATPATTLGSISTLTDGQVRVEGSGIGGVTYSIQGTTNLNPVILWTLRGTATAGADDRFEFLDTTEPQHPMQFYRVVSP